MENGYFDASFLYMNETMRDVEFFIGPTKDDSVRIPAHKFILITASPVFKTMFEVDFVERKTGKVFIDDIKPSTFKQVLRYCSPECFDCS